MPIKVVTPSDAPPALPPPPAPVPLITRASVSSRASTAILPVLVTVARETLSASPSSRSPITAVVVLSIRAKPPDPVTAVPPVTATPSDRAVIFCSLLAATRMLVSALAVPFKTARVVLAMALLASTPPTPVPEPKAPEPMMLPISVLSVAVTEMLRVPAAFEAFSKASLPTVAEVSLLTVLAPRVTATVVPPVDPATLTVADLMLSLASAFTAISFAAETLAASPIEAAVFAKIRLVANPAPTAVWLSKATPPTNVLIPVALVAAMRASLAEEMVDCDVISAMAWVLITLMPTDPPTAVPPTPTPPATTIEPRSCSALAVIETSPVDVRLAPVVAPDVPRLAETVSARTIAFKVTPTPVCLETAMAPPRVRAFWRFSAVRVISAPATVADLAMLAEVSFCVTVTEKEPEIAVFPVDAAPARASV